MISSLRPLARLHHKPRLSQRCFSSFILSTIHRPAHPPLLETWTNHERIPSLQNHPPPFAPSSTPLSLILRNSFSTSLRTRAISFRDLKSEEKAKEEKPKKEEAPKPNAELDPAEQAYRQATKNTWAKAEAERERQKAREEEEARQEEENEGEQKEEKQQSEQKRQQSEQKKEEPMSSPHGTKSPGQVFLDELRAGFKESKEWQESTKQLSSSANAMAQNESLRKAREAYSAASSRATSGTASALKTTGKAIGQSASWTWESAPVKIVRDGVSATGRGIDKATKPIRDTKAFKSVQNVVDDGSSSKYGGWIDKEERKKRRELEAQGEAVPGARKPEKMEEDPNAGTNVTLHKDSILYTKWRDFRDSNRMMQSIFSLKSSYDESDNALISTARSITNRVAGFFAENETALVIKKFKEMDPTFSIEPFLREMREYILPEVLDAYVKGDLDTLRLWLSAPQFQVYSALAQQYLTAGLKSDGKVLDIRNVDILSARKLQPGDIPVFIITCRTQEVHVYRNKKTNDLAAGMEDKVQQVTYAIGITRVPEDVNNPDTRGWRLIELQKSARDYI